MSRLAAARAHVTRRRASSLLVALVLAALAVLVASVVPGPTMRWAPFSGFGTDAASSGPLSVEVHEATLAASLDMDGEIVETPGVFVVLDVTIAATEPLDLLSRDLVIDGRVYDATTKGPSSWQESDPGPGMPVRGHLVFEVDADLVEDGATVELHVAPGLDAAGDLRPQVVVRAGVDGRVVDVVQVEVLSR